MGGGGLGAKTNQLIKLGTVCSRFSVLNQYRDHRTCGRAYQGAGARAGAGAGAAIHGVTHCILSTAT